MLLLFPPRRARVGRASDAADCWLQPTRTRHRHAPASGGRYKASSLLAQLAKEGPPLSKKWFRFDAPDAPPEPSKAAKFTVIHKRHEHEHSHSRVRSLRSRSPRAHRALAGQGARGDGRAGGPPGRARHAPVPLRRPRIRLALRLLHACAAPVRGRDVQSHQGGARLPAISGDPGSARLRRPVADVGPPAAPCLTPENHQAVLARASGRSRREIEALVAELAPRPDVPTSVRKLPVHRAAAPWSVVRTRRLIPGADHGAGPSRRIHRARPSPPTRRSDHPAHVSRALSRAVHDRQGQPRQAASPSGPSPPRDPGRRPGRDRRTRARPPSREGREGEDGRDAAARPRPIRSGTDDRLSTPLPASRDIPRSVKRAASRRDGDQCGFVARADAMHRAHVPGVPSPRPYAQGGPATVENISLRCRRHNQYEAEVAFGGRGLSEDREYGPWQRTQHGTAPQQSARLE